MMMIMLKKHNDFAFVCVLEITVPVDWALNTNN